jgi:RNA polymerase sigma-70 factor (ECF subfamily)
MGMETAATDEQILLRVRQGDPAGFDRLVRRWEAPLFAFVYRLLGHEDEARDVCQETFLRVWSQARRFREGSRFSTWMYQIALNLCRDLGRRRTRWSRRLVAWSDGVRAGTEPSAPRHVAEARSPETVLERTDTGRVVRDALDRLPPPMREVLVLKQYQELTFREIATVLDCPESTVKSRLYEGLSRMRTLLLSEGLVAPGGAGGGDGSRRNTP